MRIFIYCSDTLLFIWTVRCETDFIDMYIVIAQLIIKKKKTHYLRESCHMILYKIKSTYW